MEKLIAPSILSADFLNLAKSLDSVKNADYLHIDIMDYNFVPNLSFGPMITKNVIDYTNINTDIHLMINDPDLWATDFAKLGATSVTLHYGTTEDPISLSKKIKDNGSKVGISIKPNEPLSDILSIIHHFDLILIMSVEPGFGGQKFIPSSIDKIIELRKYIDDNNLDTIIEVDGGVTKENLPSLRDAGCDMFVAGSTVFNSSNPYETIENLKRIANNKE